MLRLSPARKGTIDLDGDMGSGRAFLYRDVLSLLKSHEIEGAAALRSYAGFAGQHRVPVREASSIEGVHLALLIAFIDAKERVEALLSSLLDFFSDRPNAFHLTFILKAESTPSRAIVQ